MVLPVSNRVSRVPLYSGAAHGPFRFCLRGYHPLWLTFPGHSTIRMVSVSTSAEVGNGPTTRYVQRRQACIRIVWAVPRSLATTSGISVLISFPEGTEMFQFPSFATSGLCIQPEATWTLLHVGFPIRRSTGRRLHTAHRRLSQFCHVLHRLLVPRHPPNALNSLTTKPVASRTQSKSRTSAELETLRQMFKSIAAMSTVSLFAIFARLIHLFMDFQ